MNEMRAQVRMLEMLVGYWDPDQEVFMIDGKTLRLEVDDIYFLTGLSHRGEVVSMKARNIGFLLLMSTSLFTVLRVVRRLGRRSHSKISSTLTFRKLWPHCRG